MNYQLRCSYGGGVKIEEITMYSNNDEMMKYYVFDDEIVAFI